MCYTRLGVCTYSVLQELQQHPGARIPVTLIKTAHSNSLTPPTILSSSSFLPSRRYSVFTHRTQLFSSLPSPGQFLSVEQTVIISSFI